MSDPWQPPPQDYHAGVQPWPPARRRKRWHWITAAVVVVVLAAGGAFLLLRGDTFTLHGSVAVSDIRLAFTPGATVPPTGAACYENAVPDGTQIVVSASNGDRLAIGTLGPGASDGGPGLGVAMYSCVFRFDVAGIPSGRGPYAVSIGSHGQILFSEAEASDLQLTLSG